MVGNYEVIAHYEECAREAHKLQADFEGLRAEIARVGEAVNVELGKARTDLASAYIGPKLTPEAIAAAEKKTGFRGFTKRNPIEAMEHEGTILAHAIARVRADERYTRRAVLVGPHGELSARVDECRELLAPWEDECGRFEQLDGFLVLVDSGYDTPNWAKFFWEPTYWKQWKQGDAICEALGMDDFGDDVLPAYKAVAAKRREWRGQVANAQQKVQDVHDLVEEHDRSVARIPQLPEIYLQASIRVLADFLAKADVELLSEWTDAEDRPVLVALHRLAGLRAKARFCQEMHGGVNDFVGQLDARTLKYMRKKTKFQRPKHYGRHHPDSVLDAKFLAKAPKYRSRQEKLRSRLAKLEAFDAYGSFDLSNDPELWWIVMTGKKPTSLTPSLRDWYARHPDRTPVLREGVSDDIALAVAQATAAAADEEDLGYVS